LPQPLDLNTHKNFKREIFGAPLEQSSRVNPGGPIPSTEDRTLSVLLTSFAYTYSMLAPLRSVFQFPLDFHLDSYYVRSYHQYVHWWKIQLLSPVFEHAQKLSFLAQRSLRSAESVFLISVLFSSSRHAFRCFFSINAPWYCCLAT